MPPLKAIPLERMKELLVPVEEKAMPTAEPKSMPKPKGSKTPDTVQKKRKKKASPKAAAKANPCPTIYNPILDLDEGVIVCVKTCAHDITLSLACQNLFWFLCILCLGGVHNNFD